MSKFAVHSGYQIDRKTFMAFVIGLPWTDDLFYRPKNRRNFDHYVLVFNSWKRRLPLKQQHFAPKVRCMLIFPALVNTIGGLIQSPIVRYSSEDRSLEKEFITHVFFPFRFVEYKAVSQLTEGHPDNMPIGEETPVDQAKFDSLIRFLKERDCV